MLQQKTTGSATINWIHVFFKNCCLYFFL